MGNQCSNQSTMHVHVLDESQGFPHYIEEFVNEIRTTLAHETKLTEYRLEKGHLFRGTMVDGKRTGYGQYLINQSGYFGLFADDLPEGLGLIIIDTKDFLRGFFKQGKPHGEGRQKINSIQFIGEYYEGQRKKGILKTEHYKYEGQLANNKLDGLGKITLKNGEIYEGEFKNGQFHGIGKYYTSNGVYNGNFHQGNYDGKGLYRWKDGTFYDGNYKNGIRNGYGRYVKEHFSHDGEWKDGKFIGKSGRQQLNQTKKQNKVASIN